MRNVLRRVLITVATLFGISVFVFCDTMFSRYHLVPMAVRNWVYVTIQPKPSPPPHWTLRHEIKTADQVDIAVINGEVESGLTALAHDYNGEMLTLLRKSDGFHSSPPKSKADLMVSILEAGGKLNESETGPTPFPMYKYVVETGELGQDHEWCYVPAEFRDWIKLLFSHSPKLQYDSHGMLIPPEKLSAGPQRP